MIKRRVVFAIDKNIGRAESGMNDCRELLAAHAGGYSHIQSVQLRILYIQKARVQTNDIIVVVVVIEQMREFVPVTVKNNTALWRMVCKPARGGGIGLQRPAGSVLLVDGLPIAPSQWDKQQNHQRN